MQSSDLITPIAMSGPLAYAGTKNSIPENATGSELASVATGFPDVTMIALDDGGMPPRGQDANGMFYLSTDMRVYQQNGGIITFNQSVSDLIGGYPKNAILDYIDSNDVYHKVQSLIDNNTYNFITNPEYINDEYWQEVAIGNSTGSGQPIGSLFWSFATADYVPEYALACDGTEYSNAMFTGLWNNYLTAETPKLLTKNYTQYQADITEYGSCAAFGVEHSISAVHSGTTITEVAVTAATWEGKVTDVGEYVFSYDGTNWSLNSEVVALADYGVILTGEAGAGDTVTVTYAFGTHFKVPTIKNTIYQGLSATVPVVGTGMSLGLTNGTRNLTLVDHWDTGAVASPLISVNGYGKSIGTNGGTSSTVNGFPTIGVTTDPTKSGLIAQLASGDASGITLRCFVVVANKSDNETAFDWSQWASSLAGKANIDASNFSSEGKSLLAGMAMPSEYIEDISGQIFTGIDNVPLYTAPADGFLFWYVDNVPANVPLFLNTYVSSASSPITNKDVIFSMKAQDNYKKNMTVGFVPIAKGQKYSLNTTSSNYGDNIWSHFIYAKGAIS